VGSAEVGAWLKQDNTVVLWTLTAVEVTSALCRLVRTGELSEQQSQKAEELLDDIVSRADQVIDVELVKASARRLLRVHPLRAADALQLGAALAWAIASPSGKSFCTLDDRLASAARREGFSVLSSQIQTKTLRG
jgi:predicted nucleic acid-binding protein